MKWNETKQGGLSENMVVICLATIIMRIKQAALVLRQDTTNQNHIKLDVIAFKIQSFWLLFI